MPVHTFNRRNLLIGAASTALFAPSIVKADRTMLSGPRGMLKGSVCDNSGVQVSDMAIRLSHPVDFSLSGACELSRTSVEGPYFICSDKASSRNLAEGVDGQPLIVALRVSDRTCTPIPGAFVDIWGCNAEGWYSGHNVDPNDGVIVRGPREPDMPSRFLRGVLATDADGISEFEMIYPGYYFGRAIHIHFKVHVGYQEFLTSQALFPEEMNSRFMMLPPYYKPRSATRLPNAEDPAFIGNASTFRVTEKAGALLASLSLIVDA